MQDGRYARYLEQPGALREAAAAADGERVVEEVLDEEQRDGLVRSEAAAMQAVALGGFLLVFLLSGLLFPVENIPAGLRWLSHFIWGKYYIEIVRDALLQGGGWPATWFQVLIVGLIGAIFYTLAWRSMRRMQLKA